MMAASAGSSAASRRPVARTSAWRMASCSAVPERSARSTSYTRTGRPHAASGSAIARAARLRRNPRAPRFAMESGIGRVIVCIGHATARSGRYNTIRPRAPRRPPPSHEPTRMTEGHGITYRDAGVDIDAGDELVERIKPLVRRAQRPEVLAGIGGFGALVELPAGYRRPVLVSGTDGVGTKLRLAIDTGRHDTIGIDLVAMCANDVIVQGAEPLFFLDYYATGKLKVATAEAVVRGIVEGCVQAGAALVGGETAQMPGVDQGEDYDLAGFCVGVVEKEAIIDGTKVAAGDAIIGLASSGAHSN